MFRGGGGRDRAGVRGVIWVLREGGRAMVMLREGEGDVEGRGGSW